MDLFKRMNLHNVFMLTKLEYDTFHIYAFYKHGHESSYWKFGKSFGVTAALLVHI